MESINRLGSAANAADPSSRPARLLDELRVDLTRLPDLNLNELRQLWRRELGRSAPDQLPKWLLTRWLAYRIQAAERGDLSRETIRLLNEIADELGRGKEASIPPVLERRLKPGTVLVREHGGSLHRVMVLDEGYAWNGNSYPSLSAVAKAVTGTNWNGYAFFGLKDGKKRRKDLHERALP